MTVTPRTRYRVTLNGGHLLASGNMQTAVVAVVGQRPKAPITVWIAATDAPANKAKVVLDLGGAITVTYHPQVGDGTEPGWVTDLASTLKHL